MQTDSETSELAIRVLRIEKRYMFIKLIYIFIVATSVAAVMVYNNNQNRILIEKRSESTRQLIACSLPAFTSSNYGKSDQIIAECLKKDQR